MTEDSAQIPCLVRDEKLESLSNFVIISHRLTQTLSPPGAEVITLGSGYVICFA